VLPMAERRMFAKTIIDSDAFIDMPLSTQALYFHLSMRADDDGFINNPKKIMRMIGASDDDLGVLLLKHFIISFETGIVVIKHWRLHNYIQKDRYKATVYSEEKALLGVKENGVYTFCIQNGYSLDTQVRLGKDSIELGKVSVGEGSVSDAAATVTTKPASDIEGILKEYEENIGSLTTAIKRTLSDQVNKYGVELVHLALVEAACNGVLKIQYIVAILNAWADKGIKTAEEAQSQINKYKTSDIYG